MVMCKNMYVPFLRIKWIIKAKQSGSSAVQSSRNSVILFDSEHRGKTGCDLTQLIIPYWEGEMDGVGWTGGGGCYYSVQQKLTMLESVNVPETKMT